MGLMTLIARKILPDKHQTHVRAPPYERKVSSKSPVRLVQTVSPTATVSNGSASPHLTDAKAEAVHPLSQTSSPESAAPAPVILGFRGDGVPARPSTSRSKQSQKATARGSFLPGMPLFSHRTAAPPRASSIKSSSPKLSVPANPAAHHAQASISSSHRAESVRTGGGGKAYVDLLDAQSEFRPADFYTRVKASGARDYGEDVADRNMGANGCDLDSRPVQAFYAVNQPRPASSWSRVSNVGANDRDDPGRPRATKKSSVDSALWAGTRHASNQAFLARRSSPDMASEAARQTQQILRRQALRMLSSSPPAAAYTTPRFDELADMQDHLQALISGTGHRRSVHTSLDDPNRAASVWDASSSESDDSFSNAPSRTVRSRFRPAASATGRPRRRPSPSSERSGAMLSDSPRHDDEPQFGVRHPPILSPQPTSARLSASLTSPALATANSRTSTVHSTQQANPESPGALLDLSGTPHRLKRRSYSFKEGWVGEEAADRNSAPSPCIKTSRPQSQVYYTVHEQHGPAERAATPPPQPHAGGAEEQTLGHASSTRHWSMSSTAPTTSSSNSATFGRPLSRHTANTSVDLNITGPSVTLNSSLVSVSSNAMGQLPLQISAYEKPDRQHNSAILPSPSFNIDDTVSSDDDSFLDGQFERGGNEEDLLFHGGYGADGVQLPGLEDAFSAPAPTVLMRRPRQTGPEESGRASLATGGSPLPVEASLPRPKASNDSLFLAGDPQSPPRRGARAPDRPPPKGGSDEGEGVDRAPSPAKRAETKRLSALSGSSPSARGHSYTLHGSATTLGGKGLRFRPHPGHHHLHPHGSNVGGEVIEEEKSDKADMAAAAHLRDESKSRVRASATSLASHTHGQGLTQTIDADRPKTSSGEEADAPSHAARPASPGAPGLGVAVGAGA